ncbi:hypothetical protein A3B40_04955 [Candidatus Roizmanbacteria bacterium RIFCSPLOWO2_01_FULL_37_16]|uniref:RNA polymerase sigma-70 region 4 domain-containing protein n=1 Tax=Candidatus Roizmanbacteria bacterium RIFCSPLOWO2_01_FULL_37_16 TaxID=1802058 RepID=A0A1F7IK28_9BACT|nr:MAG: hypothetical protein A3F57_04970 [Candidatus Roizmanbacteria bacterium RIFCSPHIGHO2_12_FULL_36_11]OGK43705.1 MAG: hypothetical protein A3B40_04955 [Candidatus Roizmanbacteria bacterium RIFCSPLOWO2_01_FULL_37_16]
MFEKIGIIYCSGNKMANQSIEYFSSIIRNSRELTRREKVVLLFRLKKKTLKKIGRKNKVTGEWIRQIEKQALTKFRRKINQLLLFD